MFVEQSHPQARCCLPVPGNFGNMKIGGVRAGEVLMLPIQEDIDVKLGAA